MVWIVLRLACRVARQRYAISLAGLILMSAPWLHSSAGRQRFPNQARCGLPARTIFWNSESGYHPDSRQPAETDKVNRAKAVIRDRLSFLLSQRGYVAPPADGVLLLSGRLLLGYAGIHWLRRGGRAIDCEWQVRFDRLAKRLGLSVARVQLSTRVSEALVVGFWRPLVLLPASWLVELPPATLEAIVAHELAHLRRHDLWINLLQRVVETLLFYHPVVWWLSSRVRQERELCCDELAVAVTGRRIEYASALELVARKRLVSPRPLLAAPIGGENAMTLLNRVRNVLGLSPRRPGANLAGGAIAARRRWRGPFPLASSHRPGKGDCRRGGPKRKKARGRTGSARR
jgi:hypothetical protein